MSVDRYCRSEGVSSTRPVGGQHRQQTLQKVGQIKSKKLRGHPRANRHFIFLLRPLLLIHPSLFYHHIHLHCRQHNKK
ncbi:hypothetical protein I308_104874 [Cryptococcus tetragattii IND107]|uniref:Uncharacterized protein n=1 Tax=Cryptococcus tetragattii IND107 TaxID=1296105 RepID=A0ABR3BPW3_9TREE